MAIAIAIAVILVLLDVAFCMALVVAGKKAEQDLKEIMGRRDE